MKHSKLNFQRGESKYLLTAEQFERLWPELGRHLVPDEYFKSTVCSLYYDSEDFELIRHSIDGPVYKEKLRIRSYGVPESGSKVFVEHKKKFRGTVYKRRVETDEKSAEDWLAGKSPAPHDSQICREIDWFLSRHSLAPKVFIASEREAYVARDEKQLRFTFDRSIRWRDYELRLSAGSHGEELLKNGQILMEIKIPSATPLWLAEMLSRQELFPTGFSKYGNCYKSGIIEKYFDGVISLA